MKSCRADIGTDRRSDRSFGLRLLDLAEAVRAGLFPARFAVWTPYLYLLPATLITGILAIGLAEMAETSLHVLNRATFRPDPAYTLANYAAVLSKPVYLRIMLKTGFAALLVTGFTLLLAFPYAYFLVRTPHARLRRFLLVALFLPFLLGQVIRAYGWLIVLGKQGLLNASLAAIGLGPVSLIYTYSGVVLGLVQYMLPFAVLLLAPALTAIPHEVELASHGLGATPWRTFRHIVLPLARPGLVAAGVVVFTLTVTDFAMPEIMGGGANDFIANAIYDAFFQLSDAGMGAALGIVLTLFASLIVALAFLLVGVATLGHGAQQDAGAGR